MPVGFTVEISGMTTAIYDQVMANMNWGPDNLPDGFITHYCCDKGDGLFIFDVWEKEDDWHRFSEERLGPAIAAATGGEGPRPEPRFFPLHNEEHR